LSYFSVFLNPKDDLGAFTGYIDITEDVVWKSFSSFTQKLDSNDYDTGVFKHNALDLKLHNQHGKYSDVNTIDSVFRNRRGGSKVRISWRVQQREVACGSLPCGTGSAHVGPTINIFDGILNDDATTLDIDDQQINFKVLSGDSLFREVETNYSSLNIGDLSSTVIYTILNQTEITKHLTVSAGNISCGLDLSMDIVTPFENQTVKQTLDEVLFGSNSVLWVRDQTVYVKPRTGGATSQKTFYGQASNNGIEDVQKMSNISAGRNNVFNFWTWKDTTLVKSDATSIGKNGLRKKEMNIDHLTNTTKRNLLLEDQKTTFADIKQEFDLTTPINYETLALTFLDKVNVDYPSPVSAPRPGVEIPIYGLAIYGTAIYPRTETSITIPVSTNFKIMGMKINRSNQSITFKLKEM